MLHTFFGTDTIAVRAGAHEFVRLRAGERGASVSELLPEDISGGVLADAAGASSLFGTAQLFIIDTPSERADASALVFGHLDAFVTSENDFVLIEGKLLAADKKKLEKAGAECAEYNAKSEKTFNPFAISDALLRRDKKSLWLLLHECRAQGMAGEQIVGLLFAAIRSLRLAAKTNSPEEAGQKPFVYQKGKRALSKFKPGEPDELSRSLVALYHDGHRGIRDLDLALEEWVLRL